MVFIKHVDLFRKSIISYKSAGDRLIYDLVEAMCSKRHDEHPNTLSMLKIICKKSSCPSRPRDDWLIVSIFTNSGRPVDTLMCSLMRWICDSSAAYDAHTYGFCFCFCYGGCLGYVRKNNVTPPVYRTTSNLKPAKYKLWTSYLLPSTVSQGLCTTHLVMQLALRIFLS